MFFGFGGFGVGVEGVEFDFGYCVEGVRCDVGGDFMDFGRDL